MCITDDNFSISLKKTTSNKFLILVMNVALHVLWFLFIVIDLQEDLLFPMQKKLVSPVLWRQLPCEVVQSLRGKTGKRDLL